MQYRGRSPISAQKKKKMKVNNLHKELHMVFTFLILQWESHQKATGSIESDSSLRTNQGRNTTMQEEIALESIKSLVEQGRIKKTQKFKKCVRMKKM